MYLQYLCPGLSGLVIPGILRRVILPSALTRWDRGGSQFSMDTMIYVLWILYSGYCTLDTGGAKADSLGFFFHSLPYSAYSGYIFVNEFTRSILALL